MCASRDEGRTSPSSGAPTLARFTALAAFVCLAVQARELVPFPSQQQMQSPQVQQSAPSQAYLVEFDRSVRDLDCAHLNQLRSKLSRNQQSATISADQQYFAQLVGIVDDYRRQRRCQPAP
jgi:hypothetical protein